MDNDDIEECGFDFAILKNEIPLAIFKDKSIAEDVKSYFMSKKSNSDDNYEVVGME